MDYKALYRQFNAEFWDYFLGSTQARDRKRVTWDRWVKRSRAAKKAMKNYLEANGAPKENPFYWVKDFPEPVPRDYNGANSLPDEPLVVALYKGNGGIYTRQEAEDFEMEIKRPFEL